MQDYGKLEKLLKEKKYYSLNDLSKQLGKNEYKVRQDLLDYLNQEVEKLSIESNQKKCKHIYKIFKYLEDAKTKTSNRMDAKIVIEAIKQDKRAGKYSLTYICHIFFYIIFFILL